MTRRDFIERRSGDWRRLDRILGDLGAPRRRRRVEAPAADLEALPLLYRAVAEDLALARHRGYGDDLVQELNARAIDAYRHLHAGETRGLRRIVRFLLSGFPRLVRANRGVVGASALLFFGPFFAFVALAYVAPEWVQAVVSPEMRATVEDSFGSDGPERSDSSNVVMFGFYVRNNVGILFRTFAGGILLGLGALFFVAFNGVVIGATFGHALTAGVGETFLAFTAGHGAPELLGIVIGGGAGLRLGLAILAPGERTRRLALAEDGRVAVRLVLGAAAMVVFAAFIEGFWSARDTAYWVRYVVGTVVWSATLLWLRFGGAR